VNEKPNDFATPGKATRVPNDMSILDNPNSKTPYGNR